jgi:hypothetical protein
MQKFQFIKFTNLNSDLVQTKEENVMTLFIKKGFDTFILSLGGHLNT